MDERDPLIERVVKTLSEPVRLDAGLDRRVMTEVRRLSTPRTRAWRVWAALEWLNRRHTVTVRPLGGLAVAAGIAALLLVGRWWLVPTGEPGIAAPESAPSVVQFVLVAPRASAVALVGDFNDWSTSATPMRTAAGDGLWTVTVPLAPGRYRYGFLLDGAEWVRDPAAPPALDDDFGRPNSVVTVRGS